MASSGLSTMRSNSLDSGISVVLPTWREVPTLKDAVDSILDQTIGDSLVELIIVVNGSDTDYFEALKTEYEPNPRIRVLHTKQGGAGHARNFGVQHATRDYVTFLDDDDWLSEGYLQEMLALDSEGVSIIFGRLCDIYNGELEADTYINRSLMRQGEQLSTDYLRATSLFGTCTCKLIKTDLLKTVFGKIPEDITHSEDVVFWAENFGKISGKLAFVKPNSEEAYMRRVMEQSVSRPTSSQLVEYVTDKLGILKHLSEIVLASSTNTVYKKFVLSQIKSQSLHIKRYCELDDSREGFDLVEERLRVDKGLLINRALFATSRGVAFCQLFPREADPSAYVATRRLSQISDFLNENVGWNVYKQDWSSRRNTDPLYDMIYAQHVYDRKVEVNIQKIGDFEWWGQRAFERALFDRAPFVYSRAQMPGSHVAASRYKELYPEALWFAEFSDPLSLDAHGIVRHQRYREVEACVFEKADKIIFTNTNQQKVMLDNSDLSSEEKESVITRSLIWSHPQIDKVFAGAVEPNYPLDSDMINVAYFGSFYKNRCHGTMIELLKNPKVVLHIFTPDYFQSNYHEIESDILRMNVDLARLKTNASVGYLEMLSLAQRMNYLFLNDVNYSGEINPYLPSKYADYLASGSKIIALIQEGSVLSSIDNDQLIKIPVLTNEFVQSLGDL